MKEQNSKEQNKNNGIMVWLVAAIVIIAVIAVLVLYFKGVNAPNNNQTNNENNQANSNVQINTTEDMESLINQAYEGLESVLPTSLMTQVIDINNTATVTSYTGLTSTENIDAIVVSEPMMSSQAYSFVLVKVKDGASADTIAKEMSEKVDTRKWICVEAEKLYATSSGNLAILIMASDDWATPVYNNLKTILGNTNQEYVKDNSSAGTEQILNDDPIIE